jgi:hypothetical protein
MQLGRDNLGSRKANKLFAEIAKGTQGDASFCILEWNARHSPTGTFSFRGTYEEAKALAIQYAKYLKGNTASVSRTKGDRTILFTAYHTPDGRLVDTVTQTALS